MVLVFSLGMILVALLLVRSEWEKLQLVSTKYEISTEKNIVIPEREDGKERLRLLFLSDLHDYVPARHDLEKILAEIGEIGPDAVLIGGDMITVSKHGKNGKVNIAAALSLIGALAEKYPVYYGEGNHETRLREKDSVAYAEYVSSLFGMGVRYLSDMTVPLTGPDGKDTFVSVSGASLEPEYYRSRPGVGLGMHLEEGVLSEKVPGDGRRFRILLLHSPAFLKDAAGEGFDLVLSGHMHGGTVRFPDGTGLMTPQYRFFVKECSGIFKEGNTAMIVTRGLGTHSVKLRLNDLPELAVIDIRKNGKREDQLQTGESGL